MYGIDCGQESIFKEDDFEAFNAGKFRIYIAIACRLPTNGKNKYYLGIQMKKLELIEGKYRKCRTQYHKVRDGVYFDISKILHLFNTHIIFQKSIFHMDIFLKTKKHTWYYFDSDFGSFLQQKSRIYSHDYCIQTVQFQFRNFVRVGLFFLPRRIKVIM